MKLIKNSGNERVIDELRRCIVAQSTLDIATPAFSLFAFAEVRALLSNVTGCRLVVPNSESCDLSLIGSSSDRMARN